MLFFLRFVMRRAFQNMKGNLLPNLTTIAISGLTYRAEKKRFLIAWDSLAIAVVYVVNVMILYMLR